MTIISKLTAAFAVVLFAMLAVAPLPAEGQDEAATATERVFWQSVADSENPADFEAYLEQWPEGVFARLARTRLAELELGDADAQFSLGERHYNGDGVERDRDEAVRLWRLAAEQGHADAQYNLGELASEYLDQDAEAVRWYRLAAEQGHADAQASLGSWYAEIIDGGRRLRDAAEAVRLWRLAAEQGHFGAQASLGSLYYFGDGVEEDHAEAVRWYRPAAEQAAEQDNADWWQRLLGRRLGEMYEYGRRYYGVDEDHAEAVRWYRLAAEQGDADAQAGLDRLQGR